MGKARRFYERCGYVRREVFAGYSEADHSFNYKKRLYSNLVAPVLLDGQDVKGLDGQTSRSARDVTKQSWTHD
jgi:hypothetical protein